MSERPLSTAPTPAEQAPVEELSVVFVDQSQDVRDEARDQADERLTNELNEGGRFKKFVSGIWKGNIARDYYRQKYVREAETSIIESQSLYGDIPADRKARALEATIDRFSSNVEEVIHTDAGERKSEQANDSELALGVKRLVREFATGHLNETTLREERTRFLNEYRERHGTDALGKGVMGVDNLLSVAKTVAGAVEHGQSLDATIENMKVITGEARNGARTEARYNAVDTVIDKLSRHKIGKFVSPEVIATAVSVTASALRFGSQSAVGAAVATVLPGVAAGAWAGARENKRVKDERAQHSREMATGGEFDQADKRRTQMEETRYSSASAERLTDHLNTIATTEHLSQGTDAVRAALDSLAAVQARVQLSDREKLDLISYSDKADVGEQRMMLDLARRQVKDALEQQLTADVRTELGIDQNQDFRSILDERVAYTTELLGGEKTEKDALFQKLKAKRVITAAATGTVVGIGLGLVSQEVVAAIDPSRFGLIDAIRGDTATPLADGLVHQTLLEGVFRGDETVVNHGPSTEYASYDTAPNGTIELSDDHTLETNADGTMDLKAADGQTTVEGLVVDSEGRLDQASLDKLDAANMVVEDRSFDQTNVTFTQQEVSTEQFVQNHIEEATNVSRELWYENDTPEIFDQNELRLYMGGSVETPGIVDGGYQYTVAGMEAGGSWNGSDSVDWNKAADNGNLFVAISASVETQDQVFMVPIGPDGSINIDENSPAGAFFSNENGTAAFNGAYMEVVQATGVSENGETLIRPLSTLVGEGIPNVTDTIPTEVVEHHAEYAITTDGYETTESNFTEMAPVIPVISRRPLEALAQRQRRAEEGRRESQPAYYNGEISRAEHERILDRVSPRMTENPDVELNPAEELSWFRGEVIRDRGQEYVDEIETFARNNPAMRSISPETASIVTIPVGAAYESENIYSTLSVFAQQDPESLRRSTFLLNVNWIDDAVGDPDKLAKMQKTISEIERAQADFPQLQIAVMQREYAKKQTKATGGVIGYVAEDLKNAALLSIQAKIASGELPEDHDMLIVRSDADVRGQSRGQLKNLQKAAQDDPNLDVVKGVTRFGIADTQKFPGFGIVSNFSAILTVASTQQNVIGTGGANFAVRAATLAGVGVQMKEHKDESTGRYRRWTGAGSDDTFVGRTIAIARGLSGRDSGSDYYGAAQDPGASGRTRRIKSVAGAAIDTNPDRLLPFYVEGESFHKAWEPHDRSFGSGADDYRDRAADAEMIENANPDIYDESKMFETIETSFSKELTFTEEDIVRKALGVMFAGVPGAYTIVGEIYTEDVKFKLTDIGRDFVKKRVERETNGRFGSYGARMMRRHYGVAPGKRQPASSVPPLVSPIVTS